MPVGKNIPLPEALEGASLRSLSLSKGGPLCCGVILGIDFCFYNANI
jgi:hypothetical protein